MKHGAAFYLPIEFHRHKEYDKKKRNISKYRISRPHQTENDSLHRNNGPKHSGNIQRVNTFRF